MSPFPRRAAKSQARTCDFEPPPPPRGWTRQGRPKGCLPSSAGSDTQMVRAPLPPSPGSDHQMVSEKSTRRPTVYRDAALSKYIDTMSTNRLYGYCARNSDLSCRRTQRPWRAQDCVRTVVGSRVRTHTVNNNNKDHTHTCTKKIVKSTRRPTVYRDQGRQIESTQAESQWIVGQSLLSALTIPGGN